MADSHVIYKAEVQVGIKDKGFKAEAKKISDRVKSLGRDLNIKPGTAEPTKEMKALQAETRKAQQELDRLLKKQESLRKAHQNSPEYKALAKDIQNAEQELDSMIAKQSMWAEMGLVGNSQFNALDDQIEQARIQLEGLYEKQRAIAESGATDKEAQEWYEVGDSVDRARRRVQELNAEQEKMKTSGSAYERAKRAATGVSSAAKKAKKEAGGAAKAFRNFGSSVGGASSKLLKFILHGKGAAGALTSMKKGLLTGAGLKPLAKLAALGGGVWLAVRGISEGMKNLVQYSGETNNSVSMLWGSLIQLKNALATAFAPIFNAAAPALNALIQLVTKAATAIAHFTAAFTGKSTVVVAKKVTTDYAAGMSDAADATGSADKAAKEYQKTLLGFDQMNILNKEDKSSGAGAGGGASGGGGLDPADMFETVDVSNGAKSLVEKIKDSWKDADFTDIGRDIGNKIGNMLDKIPWESLKETAYKVGKSIATGFNGLNDSKFWASLGTSLGESVNTVISGIKGFVENFDWVLAGKAFATGVNKFFGTVDWKDIGSTVSKAVGGILDTITTFFKKVDWEAVGSDLVDVIKGVDWAGLIVKGLKLAGSVASGILGFLKGAFSSAISGISDWITSGQIWADLSNIGKAVLDVGINLVGDAWDYIKTIVKGVGKITFELGGAILEKIKESLEWIAGKLGFGKETKPEVPKENAPQYQGHDYQGVEMTQTVTVDGKQTEGFKKLYKEYGEIKTSKATKTGGGTRTEGFKRLHTQFKEIKNNKAVKTAGGTRTDGFKKVHKQFGEVKNNTATKSLAGYLYSSFTNAKSQYDKVKEKTVTVSIQGLVGRQMKQAVISFMASGGLYRNGHWRPITAAAGGGSFSSGQVFLARETGPELVGQIGSGTAVMNNDQIVASVAKGVYEAVLSAMSMSDNGKSVNVYLQGDAGKIFKVVQREAVQFVNTTGQAPFPA